MLHKGITIILRISIATFICIMYLFKFQFNTKILKATKGLHSKDKTWSNATGVTPWTLKSYRTSLRKKVGSIWYSSILDQHRYSNFSNQSNIQQKQQFTLISWWVNKPILGNKNFRNLNICWNYYSKISFKWYHTDI